MYELITVGVIIKMRMMKIDCILLKFRFNCCDDPFFEKKRFIYTFLRSMFYLFILCAALEHNFLYNKEVNALMTYTQNSFTIDVYLLPK